MQVSAIGHTHKTNTFTSKGIPPREVLCTVFTALLHYWLVVFLRLREATPHEQGERSAHENCSRNLSLKPGCTLLTLASVLNRTFALLGTVSFAHCLYLQFPSLSLIHLFFFFLVMFSSSFFSCFVSSSQTSLVRSTFINWTADCAQQKST